MTIYTTTKQRMSWKKQNKSATCYDCWMFMAKCNFNEFTIFDTNVNKGRSLMTLNYWPHCYTCTHVGHGRHSM